MVGSIQGNFNSKCECFPVMRRCRCANSPPLAIIKSATPPASVAPGPVLPLRTIIRWPCRSYYLHSNGCFHQLTPIHIRYHNVRIYHWIMSDCWECCLNMQQLVYMCLIRWPILTASLASTGSRRLWMHVFFRDQGGRILVPSPSIRSYDPCQPAYTWPRRLSFMKSRDCPFSSCRLWLSSVYSWVWVHL